MEIKLKSPAFGEGEMIPNKHTCDGEDISPLLEWSSVPAPCKSLALICDDPDSPSGTWVHWVIYNIPPQTNKLKEDIPVSRTLEDGSRQGTNDFRKIGYGGPCPHVGTHRYNFKLYALDAVPEARSRGHQGAAPSCHGRSHPGPRAANGQIPQIKEECYVTNMKNQIKSPDELMKMVTAFRHSRVVLTAFELGIFTVVAEDKKTSVRVSRAVGADPRGTDRLMNALCALGLIQKKGGFFSNTPFSSRYLVKGKPDYLAGLAHTANLWDRWGTLTKAVRRGGMVLGRQRRGSKAAEKKRTQGFIAAMHQRGSSQAGTTIKLLDLSTVRKTLDIGAGSGVYSIALVRAKNDIEATVFDLPEVIPLTRSYIKKSGLTSRFIFREGDFDKDRLGSGYDLVLLSAVIHMNSPAENMALFKKCAGALNPGGQLVIQDFVMSADRTSPSMGAIFAMNMLIATEAGDTFTESEIRGWMKKAGLSKIRRRETPFESSLMIGCKI